MPRACLGGGHAEPRGERREWTRTPIARLGYVKKRNEWTLYCADRNSKFQRYWDTEPTQHVAELLDEIDADRSGIFWG
jgi:hypothetical protein